SAHSSFLVLQRKRRASGTRTLGLSLHPAVSRSALAPWVEVEASLARATRRAVLDGCTFGLKPQRGRRLRCVRLLDGRLPGERLSLRFWRMMRITRRRSMSCSRTMCRLRRST
ncbi:hypothetical protein FRC12_020597, partial [Ceratobasidium sp. 428]